MRPKRIAQRRKVVHRVDSMASCNCARTCNSKGFSSGHCESLVRPSSLALGILSHRTAHRFATPLLFRTATIGCLGLTIPTALVWTRLTDSTKPGAQNWRQHRKFQPRENFSTAPHGVIRQIAEVKPKFRFRRSFSCARD
jgi:hypothetical protein